MADVLLATEQLVRGGLAAAYTGSLNGSDIYQVQNEGTTILHVKKSGAGVCTVTITTFGTVDGMAITDRTVSIPASTGDKFIGPFPTGVYNDPATGYLEFTVSDITGLTVAVLRL